MNVLSLNCQIKGWEMIKTLFVKNFALIEELRVVFGKGLNILTGETGAGKSILIDAIDLAFGGRSSKDHIRTGENKALIELEIDISSSSSPLKSLIEENGIEIEDNSLIISREISSSGTRSRINGILVTQNYVQELRGYLIDIHSQHETYNYLKPATHIDLLDSYGNNKHQELLENFSSLYIDFKQKQRELELAQSLIQSKEQKTDFLRFQINEIDNAKIVNPDEYEELMQERSVLINAEELKELTYSGYHTLYGMDNSIVDILNILENKLIRGAEFDKKLSHLAETLSSATVNIKDTADELRAYSGNIDTDQQRLLEIEDRIDLLDKLKKKYGHRLCNIIDNLQKFTIELDEIEINDEKTKFLSEKVVVLENEVNKISYELSNSRKKLADELSKLIQAELIKLEMPKVQFFIDVKQNKERFVKGIDTVEFLISPNHGEPLKPLAKIASGGEISRVMLAIKTIFAKADKVNTVIFDEIDSGISGKTSQSIAEELAGLSSTHQILCITHQPIIAAMADKYFYIEKSQQKDKTLITINDLDNNQRIFAISKLASGSDQDQDSINFAMKLFNQALEYKAVGVNIRA